MESSKQQATRIRLDYHVKPDRIGRLRILMLTLTVVVLIIYLATGLTEQSVQRYSSGPLAEVHQPWATNCQVCHTDYVAIHDQAWAASPQSRRIMAENCNHCHFAAGHHAAVTAADFRDSKSCASCHHDHQGRQADLLHVHDQTCVECHAALDVVIADPNAPASIHRSVRKFDVNQHPPFRSLEADSGNVKFNHKLHLSPGLTKEGGDRGALTVGDLPEATRSSYLRAGQSLADPVQLDCASCHRPDFGAGASSQAGLGADGEYMAPIRYESHCATCHPLTLESGQADMAVPHGLSVPQLTSFVESRYARQLLETDATREDSLQLPRRMPGKPLRIRQPDDATRETFAESVDRALVLLLETEQGCIRCHDIDSQTRELHPAVPQIPTSWFRHASFNHSAHRAIDCRHCHSQPDGDRAAPDQEVVMINGIDSCVECHNERPPEKDQIRGVRSDCILCHQYHVDVPPVSSASEGLLP